MNNQYEITDEEKFWLGDHPTDLEMDAWSYKEWDYWTARNTRLMIFSDLHLEFGVNFELPSNINADILILAGDIMTFKDYSPLDKLIENWKKPIIFVAGNHEFYTKTVMDEEESKFFYWAKEKYPNLTYLRDHDVKINGVNFFGGTMWTDFENGSNYSMYASKKAMNDFRLIYRYKKERFCPEYAMKLHKLYKKDLIEWFEQDLSGPRVVISHHAPVMAKNTEFANSEIKGAFNSLDMIPIIEEYQPDLWIYGHTHECDDQFINNTRIISNQRGYEHFPGKIECGDLFDPEGKITLVHRGNVS